MTTARHAPRSPRNVTWCQRARLIATTALAGSLSFALVSNAYALPGDGVVVGGQATIAATAPGALVITQTSANTAINWQSFSIGQGESVQFVQPDARSVALNRVLGADPSVILGRLSSNGQVFLTNPNGVLFGQTAQVNVGGLVASTLSIRDADFMAGRYQFFGAGPGSVVNDGAITANGGSVALLGGQVSNQGLISARLGAVTLAAGSAMALDVAGDGLLSVTVQDGAVNALAENGGIIRADGGRVLMTSRSADALLRSAVNNTGLIEARTLESRDGVISLMGDMTSGTVNVAGTIDASAPSGGDGGFVETSAATVKVADGTVVTTLAHQGKGGLWLLDPTDFTIAAGADESGAQVSADLAGGSKQIVVSGNIHVNESVTWAAPTTLTLDAGQAIDNAVGATLNPSGAGSSLIMIARGGDITLGDAVNGAGGNVLIRMTASGDIWQNSPITNSGAGSVVELNAGHDVKQAAAITASGGGAIILRGDADGTGGPGGGTVNLAAPAAVTADTLSIFYSPTGGYGAPSSFAGVVVPLAGFSAKMWAFAGAANKVYDGGTSATLAFRNGDPTVGGTVAVAIAGSGAFLDPNVGSAKPVTLGGASLNGAGATKYALYDPTAAFAAPFPPAAGATASITPASLTIIANNVTKPFGVVATLPGTGFTSTGLVAGQTVGSVTLASSGLAAGANVANSPYTITPSAAVGGTFSAGNYAITYVNGLLTVIPGALIITANNAAKTYGQAVTFAPGAFTTSGLSNGDTIGSVVETSAGAGATAGVAGSPYVIIPSAAAGGTFLASNYTVSYVNGALTVTPAPLVVQVASLSKAYGQVVTFAPGAFSSVGLQNGETIGTVAETSAGAVAGATVPGGPYAISGSGAAGGTYNPANYATTYLPGQLTVTPVALVVTANDASKSFGQTLVFTGDEFSATGLVNGDTVGLVTLSSPGATAGAAPTTYAITPGGASGGTFIPADYVTTYVAGVLTVDAPAAIVGASGAALHQMASYPGFPTSPGDSSGGVSLVSATDGETDVAATGAFAGAPAGVQLAVLGQGVRMPVEQVVLHRNEQPIEAPAQQGAEQTVQAPAQPLATPAHPPKQDRN